MTAGGAYSLKASARASSARTMRRGIVEQHDERALGGRAIVRAELGIKIGAGQSGGGIASLRGAEPCASSAGIARTIMLRATPIERRCMPT